MKIVGFILVFLFFGAFFIISNKDLALKDPDKRMDFARSYYSWFLGIGKNIKSISGNVIKSTWLPKDNDVTPLPAIIKTNSSNSTTLVNVSDIIKAHKINSTNK